MSFYGSQFSFDGIPSFEYGLMLYDINGTTEDGIIVPEVKIVEDRINQRYAPLHYGTITNSPLTFSLTFGADINAIDKHRHLDRWELETIATWLTGHNDYKYLEIEQPDMENVRYRCIITKLEYITYGKMPWALRCQVTCDSPYAYTYPEEFQYDVSGTLSVQFNNRASCMHYKPEISILVRSGSEFSIINHSDNDRKLLFSSLPSSIGTININNENEIITTSSDLNAYPYFNYNFFRLIRGDNTLEFVGDGMIVITCAFPLSFGG